MYTFVLPTLFCEVYSCEYSVMVSTFLQKVWACPQFSKELPPYTESKQIQNITLQHATNGRNHCFLTLHLYVLHIVIYTTHVNEFKSLVSTFFEKVCTYMFNIYQKYGVYNEILQQKPLILMDLVPHCFLRRVMYAVSIAI